MNILKKLTIKNLKLNKKRTIMTIIGIILSVALLTSVTTMFFSAKETLIIYEKTQRGNYHFSFNDIPKEDQKYFEEHRDIESISYLEKVGYANIPESKNPYKPYAYIINTNKDGLENLGFRLLKGRLPEKEDEILTPSHLKTNGRVEYKIGETLTLDIGTRIREDKVLDQSNPFIEESEGEGKEEIINTQTKTYKIVGIIERPSSAIEDFSAPGYTFVAYKESGNTEGSADLYIRLTKEALSDPWETLSSITGVDKKYYELFYSEKYFTASDEEQKETEKALLSEKNTVGYIHQHLIELETKLFGPSETKALGFAAIVVCIIIIFTSVFCIKNSFDISITEKTRQYGMLSSIGATQKQIKKNVYYEASVLGIIGIPLGVILGILASFILIELCKLLLITDISINLVLKISILGIILVILLGIITIYLSARRSAKKASKINPITAIRGNNDIKITSKKIKSPKYIKKIFKIGGNISYKNIKRNKKKYRATILSIIVCSSIFIGLYFFINIAFDTVKKTFNSYDYNISVSYDYENEILPKKAEEILKLENIKDYSVIRENEIYVDHPKLSKEFNEINPSYLDEIKYQDDDGNEKIHKTEDYLNIVTLGDHAYNNYIKKLKLDYDKVNDKAILINYTEDYKENPKTKVYEQVTIPRYTYKVGDKIELYEYDKNDKNQENKIILPIEIASITKELPFGLQLPSGCATLIVSNETRNKQLKKYETPDYYSTRETIYIDSEDPNTLQDQIDDILFGESYRVQNIAEDKKSTESLYIIVAIFLYGFIIVIALIGTTNIFNTITTNMELRKQEFAMLKSIGMTNKEFNNMIRLESFLYGTKSLIIGIPIGLIISYILYKILSVNDSSVSFEIPYIAILITIIIVFILIISIMKYSLSKINKQNTIETIRNENI